MYDLYGPIRNAFDAGKSITRASGRGLGPVKWQRAVGQVPFGAQKVKISRTQPPPISPSKGLPASKALCTGLYQSEVHGPR
jgi:hypothetical protein